MPLEYQWAALMLLLMLSLPLSFVLVRIAGKVVLRDAFSRLSPVPSPTEPARLASFPALLVRG